MVTCMFFQLLQAQNEGAERDNTPKYSNEYMNIGVSARSFGMGFTAVSFTNDVTAGYWNPAGLNHLESNFELSLMHSDYFNGLANYDYGTIAAALKDESKIALSIMLQRFRFEFVHPQPVNRRGTIVLFPDGGLKMKLHALAHLGG